ncbi:MAG: sulfite exporter TauE/SafE family protein [Legionella sp.]|nr:sulfite exporter TauE/SafE family protein [Legionella sp.]
MNFDWLSIGFIYICIGMIAGVMAGVFGIGGGLVIVPGLLFIFHHYQLIPDALSMQAAAASSLAIMIFTSQSSVRAHSKISGILWQVFHTLWPGLLLGTLAGVLLANFIPRVWLKSLFAVFLFIIALKMLMDIKVTRPSRFPSKGTNFGFTYAIGVISGLLGVGGGLSIVPYLSYCGVETRKMPGITNLCSLVVAFVGTTAFMITGISFMSKITYSTGYVYWPAVLCVAIPSTLFAPIGAKLNYIIPQKQLKYCFIMILLITALSLLF